MRSSLATPKASPGGFGEPPYIADTLRRASRRRDRVIDAILLAGREASIPLHREEEVYEIINRLHSAAVIVDDMVDSESFRRGMLVFHKRYSAGIAALGALHLLVDAIRRTARSGE